MTLKSRSARSIHGIDKAPLLEDIEPIIEDDDIPTSKPIDAYTIAQRMHTLLPKYKDMF